MFYRNKIEREKEFDLENLILKEKQKDAVKEKDKLLTMQSLVMQAIDTKNNEIKRLIE